MSANVERLLIKSNEKLTWGELIRRAQEAGITDDDEIDNISVSWGSPDELEIKRDEDFGWQISLGINF